MTSQTINAILALADTLNFSKAAAGMNITQPAFSRMISRAEEEVGFKIFIRNTRFVSLTHEGESFITFLRQATYLYRFGVNCSRQMMKAENCLNIGISATFVCMELAPILLQFEEEHPDICLNKFPMPMEDIPVKLRNGIIDIGLFFTEKTKFSSDFSFMALKKISFNAVVNIKHPLSQRKSIFPFELESENIVTLQTNVQLHEIASYGPLLAMLNKKHGIRLESRIVVPSTQEQLMHVACNHGIALLASSIAHVIPKNTVTIPIEDGMKFYITALWNKKDESRLTKVFLDDLEHSYNTNK